MLGKIALIMTLIAGVFDSKGEADEDLSRVKGEYDVKMTTGLVLNHVYFTGEGL